MLYQYATVRNYFTSRIFLKKGLSTRNLFRNFSKEKVQVSARFSNGRTLSLETGRYARMADGAVVASMGDTSVLVTAVSKAASGHPPSFLPLTVDYRQKYAAAGRIPTNFLKREMGLSEQEILTSRVIDRSVRPLFPEGFRQETQLTCNLMAVGGVYSPDVVSINAASAALAVSSIPWEGPVGAVRIGYCDDEWFINPNRKELQHSALDIIVVAGPKRMLVMLEGGCNNIPLPKLQKGIKRGVSECQTIVNAIQVLAQKAGKSKTSFETHVIPQDIIDIVHSLCHVPLTEVLTNYSHNKLSRDQAITAVRQEMQAAVAATEQFKGQESDVEAAFQKTFKSIFRSLILDTGIRCDGRDKSDLRPISCSADVFHALHGSSLFQRGQTQVQCTVAYDSLHPNSAINPLLNATGGAKDRNFLLHYAFPALANNEVGRSGPLSRREVGHGALAERALRPLLPPDMPLTVLLAATVLESNGSSSMATVCGGSLAMYDAGVKLVAPAAGVAMGLVTNTDEEGNITDYKVLTDILGIEDYLGDMDFKIAGTRKGITAVQADVKLAGLPLAIVMEALENATEPRARIIDLLNEEMSEPRTSKETWPVVTTFDVPASRRARFMGPGGSTLRRLQAQTGVEIWWENATQITMFAPNSQAHDEAKEVLDGLLVDKEPQLEFGAIYSARVTEIRNSGVMLQLYDDMPPVLLHNSQLDVRRVHHPSALGIEVGESIKVKYFGRDATSGQMRLSRRAIQAASIVTKDLHKPDAVLPVAAAATVALDDTQPPPVSEVLSTEPSDSNGMPSTDAGHVQL